MIQLVLIIVLLAVAGFFVLVARSFHHVSHHHLEDMAQASGRFESYQKYLSRHDQMQMSAAILGVILEGVLVVVVVVSIVEELGANRVVTTVDAIIVSIVLMGLVCEGLMEVAARAWAEQIVLKTAPLMAVIAVPFGPIYRLDRRLERYLEGSEGQNPQERAVQDMTDEILSAVTEGEKTGALDDEAGQMIEGVISLAQGEVSEVMTPRTEIVGVRAEQTIEEAVDVALEKGHSRLPVYEVNLDNIVGVVLLKDLLADLKTGGNRAVGELMRPPYFVPESKRISELLRELRQRKMQTAIVLDEYGGTAGLVTVEDIVEEIVGEIGEDHGRRAARPMRRIDATTVEVGSRCDIEQLNEALDLGLPEDPEYDTVTGFVLHRLGRIPKRGERFETHGARFEVLEADPRSITRLRVHRLSRPGD